MSDALIDEFDRLIRRDPAQRGLIMHEPQFGPLCTGHLHRAAAELARTARHVGLVTGFYVPYGRPPAAETDGPPGTLLLARSLEAVGVEVTLVTDQPCLGAVQAAARASGFGTEKIVLYGCNRSNNGPGMGIDEFFSTGPGRTMTHLIAVERVGPSHTRDSFLGQKRDAPPPLEDFADAVPLDAHGRHFNMRGEPIDEHTADMHRLFEDLHRHRPEARTIGIGDGGNEIGMGTIPWEELRRRLEGRHAARIPCRVQTDWTIIAGTSNWGAYALAAALLVLRDAVGALREADREHQRHVLEEMVAHGPAVDGATGRREPTVDGLPFLTYIQPWEGIRRLLGLPL